MKTKHVSLILSILITSFILLPAKGYADFSFGAAGDFRHDNPVQSALGPSNPYGLDFFIGVGDLSYIDDEEGWCGAFKKKFNNLLFVVGNHDVADYQGEEGRASDGQLADYQKFCPYPLTDVPYTGTYGEQYYFDYPVEAPLARFILIPAGLMGHPTDQTWLANAIRSAKAQGRWVIVGMHLNCITTGAKDCEIGHIPHDYIWDFKIWDLLFEEKVDLILQGHEHNYQRSHSLACAPPSPPPNTPGTPNLFDSACVADSGLLDNTYGRCAGSVVVIQGTGGAGLHGVNFSDPEAGYFDRMDAITYGFVKYTVTATSITGEFKPLPLKDDSFTDNFTIKEEGPSICDNDSDGLTNSREWELGTNPNDTDTDDDGLTDGKEVELGLNPLEFDNPIIPIIVQMILDGDDDNDGVDELMDNCPAVANPDQTDTDRDGQGDTCDSDDDNDGVSDTDDCAPLDATKKISVTQYSDTDRDGVRDSVSGSTSCTNGTAATGFTLKQNGPDNCPKVSNPKQEDFDGDGRGSACERCEETDNGNDPAMKGIIQLSPKPSQSIGVISGLDRIIRWLRPTATNNRFEDTCIGRGVLQEYFCKAEPKPGNLVSLDPYLIIKKGSPVLSEDPTPYQTQLYQCKCRDGACVGPVRPIALTEPRLVPSRQR